MLRAVHSHAAVCRTAAAVIRDAYPLAGAGCRLSDGETEYRIGMASSSRIAQYPISPNIGEYRPIPQ